MYVVCALKPKKSNGAHCCFPVWWGWRLHPSENVEGATARKKKNILVSSFFRNARLSDSDGESDNCSRVKGTQRHTLSSQPLLSLPVSITKMAASSRVILTLSDVPRPGSTMHPPPRQTRTPPFSSFTHDC